MSKSERNNHPRKPRRVIVPRVGAQLAGRLAWTLERAGRVVASGDHANLITDAGLDNFADTENAHLYPFSRYARLGTGSNVPAVSDVSLAADIGVSDQTSFATVTSGGIAGGQEVLTATRSYAFDFAASYNLTEWGLSPNADGSDMSVRSLFYEADGVTAKTISVQANDRLTLTHNLDVTVSPVGINVPASWTLEEYDRVGTKLGETVFPGWMTVGAGAGNETIPFYRLTTALPGRTIVGVFRGEQAATACNPDAFLSPAHGAIPTELAEDLGVLDAYQPGTYTRRSSIVVPADEGNAVWYGWDLARVPYFNSGVGALQFVADAASFTKLNTHTLEFATDVSWSRNP